MSEVPTDCVVVKTENQTDPTSNKDDPFTMPSCVKEQSWHDDDDDVAITRGLNTDLSAEINVRVFGSVFQLTHKRPNRRMTSIRLNIQKCLALREYLDDIEEDLRKIRYDNAMDIKYHLGGHVFTSISAPYWGVNIRKWERYGKDNQLRPSFFKGVFIKHQQFNDFAVIVKSLGDFLPILNDTERCMFTHDGQQSAIECFECNPDGDTANFV